MEQSKKNNLWDKNIFWGTFLSVIVIHSTMLTNKIAWHDAAGSIYGGWRAGFMHGRWFYQIVTELMVKCAGIEEIPMVHGIMIGLSVAGMVVLLYDLFEIKDKKFRVALIPIFAAIPAITGNLGYMGSSGQNFIGLFICVLGAYILCKGICNRKNIGTYILATFLCACSIGAYQCYISFYLSILLVYVTQLVIKEHLSWKEYFGKAIYYVASAVFGLAMYLVINEAILKLTNTDLTSYAGTDTYGIVSIEQYISRLIFVYKDFVGGGNYAPYSMFPFQWKVAYPLLLTILVLLAIAIIIIKIVQHNISGAIQFLIVFCLLPLGLNFNFILYDSVHSLHMYHYVLYFVYVAICISEIKVYISIAVDKNKVVIHKIVSGLCGVIAGIIMMFGALYVRYDNSCYMSAQIRHDATVSYYSTLVGRIQSIEGYRTDLPVAFINDTAKVNTIDTIKNVYDYPLTNPYNYPMVNCYTWRSIMYQWCDYAPQEVPADTYKDNQKVMEMPSYPNDGSIQIIDNVIVVKF